MKSSDVLVVLGGQCGTLLEIVVAYQYQIPVVVLGGSGEMVDRLEGFLISDSYLDERHTGRVAVLDSMSACKAAVLAAALGSRRLSGLSRSGTDL